jgi:UDP-2,3-diacylglucosamine pyrophosphatase LpxH
VQDAVILSDLHLGGDNSRARDIVELLERLRIGRLTTRRLILNGDVFDSFDFRRLKKPHWKVLSAIRKLSDDIETVWVHGNHDGDFESISPLLGIDVVNEYRFESGGRRVLVLHGHQFDKFINKHPLTTKLGDTIYWFLQKIDRSHTVARYAKRKTKIFMRNIQAIETGAVAHARETGAEIVCCGHTHMPIAKPEIGYFNSGCWTESPPHYLTVRNGRVDLVEMDGDRLETEPEPEVPETIRNRLEPAFAA